MNECLSLCFDRDLRLPQAAVFFAFNKGWRMFETNQAVGRNAASRRALAFSALTGLLNR
jgi:hypothetical protein